MLFLEYLKGALGDLVAPRRQIQAPDLLQVNPNNLQNRENS